MDVDLPDLKKFSELINSPNELTLFVMGHLLVEFMIEQLIKRNLEKPDLVIGKKTGFANKLQWLESIGLLKDNYLENAKILNEIRNQFAHNLNPADKVIEEKIKCLTPFRQITEYDSSSPYDKYRTVVLQFVDDLQKAITFDKPLGEKV